MIAKIAVSAATFAIDKPYSYAVPEGMTVNPGQRVHVLLDIEPNGAAQVKRSAPEAVLVFIMPPSIQELERRLRGRGDTSEEQIKLRMERATWEMEQRSWYDYVVTNDDARRCADEILKIIDDLV